MDFFKNKITDSKESSFNPLLFRLGRLSVDELEDLNDAFDPDVSFTSSNINFNFLLSYVIWSKIENENNNFSFLTSGKDILEWLPKNHLYLT